jgi:hypothetical protein
MALAAAVMFLEAEAVQVVVATCPLVLQELRLGELRRLGKETLVAQQFQIATPVGRLVVVAELVVLV